MSRLLPELSPDERINREELALLLGCETDDASAVLLAEIGEGLTVLHGYDDDGHDAFRLGDVEAIAQRRKSDPRSPKNPRPSNRRSSASTPPRPASTERVPLAPEVRDQGGVIFADDQATDAILLSDNAGTGTAGKSKAIRIRDAAEQVGLTEEELTTRLLGKAHLAMHEGDMVVKLADLQGLAERGVVPRPSTVKAVTQATAEIEGKPRSGDSATEARIAAAADRIGLDRDEVRAPGASPSKAEERTDGMAAQLGVDLGKPAKPSPSQTAAADDATSRAVTAKRGPRRLLRAGQPQPISRAR